MRALLVAVVSLVVGARAAEANSACGGMEGWSLPSKSTVPVHPIIAFYTDARMFKTTPVPTPIAKINGKDVPAKVSLVTMAYGSQAMVLVEIDSPKTGTLKISWGDAHNAPDPVTYTIKKQKPPKTVTGKWSRYHVAYRHSTVHELEDGLEVRVNAKAVRFRVKYRRDDQTPWQTQEVPAMTKDGKQVLHLGEVGCSANFFVGLLTLGVDLELTAILADGTELPVTGLPARIVLPALPADAAQSEP